MDGGENTIEVCENIRIPKPQHKKSSCFQVPCPFLICFDLFRMLPAIKFDNELCVMADKIRDISKQWNLPPELEAFKLPVAKPRPENGLRIGLAFAQGAGLGIGCWHDQIKNPI